MTSAPGAARPNILLIMADQLSAVGLGCYGHPVVKTPHLDRLAGRGMQFDSMYSNSPLCAPARLAMMSGQRNSRIGAYDNASEFAASMTAELDSAYLGPLARVAALRWALAAYWSVVRLVLVAGWADPPSRG